MSVIESSDALINAKACWGCRTIYVNSGTLDPIGIAALNDVLAQLAEEAKQTDMK